MFLDVVRRGADGCHTEADGCHADDMFDCPCTGTLTPCQGFCVYAICRISFILDASVHVVNEFPLFSGVIWRDGSRDCQQNVLKHIIKH